MIHRVFAYGSNMHVPDLRAWMERRGHHDGKILESRAALLRGWELVWDYRSSSRGGGAANIQPRADAVLPGVVLSVDRGGLAAIDRKEGHPGRYCRGESTVGVVVGPDRVDAWLYVVTADYRLPHSVPPRPDYLRLVIEGAVAHGLPAWHIDALRQVATES